MHEELGWARGGGRRASLVTGSVTRPRGGASRPGGQVLVQSASQPVGVPDGCPSGQPARLLGSFLVSKPDSSSQSGRLSASRSRSASQPANAVCRSGRRLACRLCSQSLWGVCQLSATVIPAPISCTDVVSRGRGAEGASWPADSAAHVHRRGQQPRQTHGVHHTSGHAGTMMTADDTQVQ